MQSHTRPPMQIRSPARKTPKGCRLPPRILIVEPIHAAAAVKPSRHLEPTSMLTNHRHYASSTSRRDHDSDGCPQPKPSAAPATCYHTCNTAPLIAGATRLCSMDVDLGRAPSWPPQPRSPPRGRSCAIHHQHHRRQHRTTAPLASAAPQHGGVVPCRHLPSTRMRSPRRRLRG